MEAIGQLTGGVAHDFNNILTVVLTSTELLEREVPDPGPDVREELEQIRRAALRAKEMTRKLLAFSRAGQLQLQRTDLGALVRDVSALLQRILPARISVDCAVGDPPAIRGDPGAIEQIILNLATNGRDAMPQGGRLRLETDRGRPAEDAGRPLGRVGPGMYARLTVRDTGVGMLPAVRERAFEPFFTTKPAGAGTGLGLAMVYGLMQQHGGLVDVESAPGQGTAVHLFFPAAPEAAAAPAPVRAGPAELAPRGAETVLLVDDEPAICRATRRLLESYGYTVVEAKDGEEGLREYRAHQREIGLVLSDVVMPEMDGRALYDAVRATGSAVPFLFMSGYTAPPEGGEGPLIDPDLPLLHKPWTAGDLLHRVRAVLDAARGPTKR
jgi:CheY-like chemotaxis protein